MIPVLDAWTSVGKYACSGLRCKYRLVMPGAVVGHIQMVLSCFSLIVTAAMDADAFANDHTASSQRLLRLTHRLV